MRKSIVALVLAAAAALTLTACDAPRIDPEVPVAVLPPNPVQGLETLQTLTTTVPGTILTERGYTPVNYLFSEQKVVGMVWIHCPKDESVYECGAETHNRGTAENPNVYVVKDKVARLEGQHDGSDDRSFNVEVPDAFQDFSKLSKEQIDGLLHVMSQVESQYNDQDLSRAEGNLTRHSLKLKLDGKPDGATIDAWTYVSRF